MTDLASYIGLFTVALLSATILPAQSEAALMALLIRDEQPWFLLLTVASVGNILGSSTNWLLGRWAALASRRSRYLEPKKLERATRWYTKWGKWSLLLSWVPIIGDPITMVAGLLGERFWTFLGLVTIAKVSRYAVLTAVTLNLL